MKIIFRTLFVIIPFCIGIKVFAQEQLLANVTARDGIILNGKWQYIVDPYETGFYDYRYKERAEKDKDAYWNTDKQANKTDKKEHGYVDKYSLQVPGDWNSQDPKFLYYEGTVWYKKSFDFKSTNSNASYYIYFGAVNYKADVYLNGKKLGEHKGGFTAFNFPIADSILKEKDNWLVVKVDNKRYADEVPTLNTDWWNYGGITRDVKLISIPKKDAIIDYSVGLKKGDATTSEVVGSVQLTNATDGDKVTVSIPELKLKQSFDVRNNVAELHFTLPVFQRWSTETPKCYQVNIATATSSINDKIGFRTIAVDGKKILLNGKPVFLRGISIHEEISEEARRAHSRNDALRLLGKAKELGCNMVRLAHYPHNENMTRMADSLGILVWSEIPVYWTIDFKSNEVLQKAKKQLAEMIERDHNRASIIIWSVGNETPLSEARTAFMYSLLQYARLLDSSRLVSAALEVNYFSEKNIRSIDDPLGAYVDVVAFNEYLGWYGGSPDMCRQAVWTTKYNKPLFISETGGEALAGYHADSLTLWSEEYQEWFFKEQTAMLKRMPDNFVGISPWVLTDFRSPKRNNPTFQDGWNNKGLIGQKGQKKKAFYVVQKYYAEMKAKTSD